MRSSSAVTCERIEYVALLRLNAPEQNNTLTASVLEGLAGHLDALAIDPNVRAVVLTGEGRNFSLGGDFGEFSEALSHDEQYARQYCASRTSVLAEVVARLYEFPLPIVAAVNGQAAGAGFSIALACDLRIAEERTRFHFAYGALGASTDGGMSWLLPRVVGPGKAMALLLEQPVIRASRAMADGLVSEVAPKGELVNSAVAVASLLTSNASHANRTNKRLLHLAQFRTLREHMQEEHLAFADGLMSYDMQRALAARQRGESSMFN